MWLKKFLNQIFISKNYHNEKVLFASIIRIWIIIFISIGFFFVIYFLYQVTHQMGGTFAWNNPPTSAGGSPTWHPPQSVSQYIPFFGSNLDYNIINQLPYILMIIFIIGIITIVTLVTLPLWLIKNKKHKFIHLIIFNVLFSMFFILALIYSILIGTDKTVTNKSLVIYMILITIFEFFILTLSISYLVLIRMLLKNNIKIDWTKVKKRNINNIFLNVHHHKADLTKNQENEIKLVSTEKKLFINYNLLAKIKPKERYRFLLTKKREAIFRNYPLWFAFVYVCISGIIQQLVYSGYLVVNKILIIAFSVHAYAGTGASEIIVDNLNLATRYATIINNIVLAFVMLIAASSCLLFSYGYGRRDKNEMSRVIGNSITNGIIVSVIVIAVGLGLEQELIKFQQSKGNGTTTQDYKMAYYYIVLLICSFPLQLASFLFLGYLRCEGKTLLTTLILVVSFVIDIILNIVLLKFTSLGIIASAIALLITYIFSFITCLLFTIFDKHSLISFKLRDLKIDSCVTKYLYIYGCTNFVQVISSGVGMLMVGHLITDSPINAIDFPNISPTSGDISNGLIQNLAAMSTWMILFVAPLTGLIIGAQSMISYCYSARHINRMWKFTKLIFYISSIYCCIILLIVGIAGTNMMSLFSDLNKFKTSVFYYRINFVMYASIFIFLPASYVGICMFQAINQPRKSLLLSSIRSWINYMPFVIIAWAVTWIAQARGNHHPYNWFFGITIVQNCTLLIWVLLMWIAFYKKHKKRLHRKDKISRIDEEINNFSQLIKSYGSLKKMNADYEKIL